MRAVASAAYTWHDEDQAYRAFAVDVFTLDGLKIKQIDSFIARSPQQVTDEQIEQEVRTCLEFSFATFALFGFDVKLELSTYYKQAGSGL